MTVVEGGGKKLGSLVFCGALLKFSVGLVSLVGPVVKGQWFKGESVGWLGRNLSRYQVSLGDGEKGLLKEKRRQERRE